MKFLQHFFQYLIKYQQVKYELRSNLEILKSDIRIKHASEMDKINNPERY